MTITLAGHANPKFLGQRLAEQFPAMAGRTQVICTTDKSTGSRVRILTNAAVNAADVEAFVRSLSRQVVTEAVSQDEILTPDQAPKTRRVRGRRR